MPRAARRLGLGPLASAVKIEVVDIDGQTKFSDDWVTQR